MFNVLFVCMGNICRSPTADGVLRHMVQQRGLQQFIGVDSAGTHDYHPGSAPDERSQQHAARRGYDLATLRARQIEAADFERFNLILAMDADNLNLLRQRCPVPHQHKLQRLTAYCRVHHSEDVPDPYYGDSSDFERVLDLVEDACQGLLAHMEARSAVDPPIISR
ncbi:MAG: low molecular weight protein-tyrosine-phosphatase [Rhodoferax sp.]